MHDRQQDSLIFLSYGNGPQAYETLFSILTLGRFPILEFQGIKIRVVTDQPDFFGSYGCEIVPVSSSTIEEWKGPSRFHHRCKVMALKHGIGQFGGRCILVDGDTYFVRPPARLFQRIGPGRSVMHMVEGLLANSTHDFNHRLGAFLQNADPGDDPSIELAHGPSTVQWNSGVVGLDASDSQLLDELLNLLDYLLGKCNAVVLEQLAFSIVLAGRTRLRPSRDVIFHYNVSPTREAFRDRIPELLAESKHMSPPALAKWLYARRLRLSLSAQARILAKDVLNTLGILPRRDRCGCF
jgi:hypothetical protein